MKVYIETEISNNLESLEEALAFVLDHVAEVGPDPHITVDVRWTADMHTATARAVDARRYRVVVTGKRQP